MKHLFSLPLSAVVLAAALGAAMADQHGEAGKPGPAAMPERPTGPMPGMMNNRQPSPPHMQGHAARHHAMPGMMGHGMMGPMMMGGMMGPQMMVIMLDTDGDGSLSLEEFQAVHERMFKFMDKDGDGQLAPDEFGRPRGGGDADDE